MLRCAVLDARCAVLDASSGSTAKNLLHIVRLAMLQELVDAGCPGNVQELGMLAEWLQTQEASTLQDIRCAGNLSSLEGVCTIRLSDAHAPIVRVQVLAHCPSQD